MEQMHNEQERHDMEMRNIIEEARVVLPGVQALFGFQTIAVFNDRFEELVYYAKACHALGMIMVIISIAMVMTPAIYYRSCHGHATASMVKLSSRMIRGALWPLAAGLALDMFTVMHVVATGMSARMALSVGAGVGTLALLFGFWFILPRRGRRK
jgi:predicted anti-sigma-YlaC factor YlaD